MVNVPVDLAPDALALYFGAVVEYQCSSCEVAEPQDVGVLLVSLALVSLADQVLVQCDLRLVAPPLRHQFLDCVVEVGLFFSFVQHVGVYLSSFSLTMSL